MCRILFIDVDVGTLSIVDEYGDSGTIDVVDVNEYSDMTAIYRMLRQNCQKRDASNGHDSADYYNTVVIDTLTELDRHAIAQIQGVRMGQDPLGEESAITEGDTWNRNLSTLTRLMRAMRALPMHVIYVCHEVAKETSKGSQVYIRRPNLPGKLMSDVQGFVDVVGYLRRVTEANEQKFKLHIQPHRLYNAKCRIRGLKQPVLDDPTLADLLQPLQSHGLVGDRGGASQD